MPRRWKATAPAAGAVPAVPAAVVASGTLMSCTVWPGPNSMPVVSSTGVVVRGATQSGPVMLESDCVIVPGGVGVAAVAAPVDADAAVGVVAAAPPPPRVVAAPPAAGGARLGPGPSGTHNA